jgi:hypothetical protein
MRIIFTGKMNVPYEMPTRELSYEEVGKRKLKISVEGIIGCGKSRLMNY